jgi:hypothetical protein
MKGNSCFFKAYCAECLFFVNEKETQLLPDTGSIFVHVRKFNRMLYKNRVVLNAIKLASRLP